MGVALLIAVAGCSREEPAEPTEPAKPAEPAVAAAALTSAALPVLFEENRGQTDASVGFVARSRASTVFLTTGGAVLSVAPAASERRPALSLALDLVGAHADATLAGARPADTVISYAPGLGGGAALEVRGFGEVRGEGVYPGVDVVYRLTREGLRFDFEVAPGADPAAIRLRLRGAGRARPGHDGRLVVDTDRGPVEITAPRFLQGEGDQRIELAGSFALHDGGEIGFAVDAYDRSRKLVIDPTLVASFLYGSDVVSSIAAVAWNGAGNLVLVGTTHAAGLPPSPWPSPSDDRAIWVGTIDMSGPSPPFVDRMHYVALGEGHDLAIAGDDVVYIAGIAGDGFPVSADAAQTEGEGACFAARLADDLDIDRASLVGIHCVEASLAVESDASTGAATGVYVAGSMTSVANMWSDLVWFQQPVGDPGRPPGVNEVWSTPGVHQEQLVGFESGFVAKLAGDLTTRPYLTYLGGCYVDRIHDVAVRNGEAYVTGMISSPDFPITPGAFHAPALSPDACVDDSTIPAFRPFAAHLSADASQLLYSTGLYDDSIGLAGHAWSLAVDGVGQAHVAGAALVEPQLQSDGSRLLGWLPPEAGNARVWKLTADGSGVDYDVLVRPGVALDARDITLDAAGNAILAGTGHPVEPPDDPAFLSLCFAPGNPCGQEFIDTGRFSDRIDAMVAVLDPAGAWLAYETIGFFDWRQDEFRTAAEIAGAVARRSDGATAIAGGVGTLSPSQLNGFYAIWADLAAAPRLWIGKELEVADVVPGPCGASVGDTGTYTLRVVNVGTAPATGVVVDDTLPAGFDGAAPAGCSFDAQTRLVRCPVGDLAPHASSELAVTGTFSAVGDVVNRAVARADGVADVPSADVPVRVCEPPPADFSLVKLVQPGAQPGEVTFYVTATVSDAADAVAVVITDAYPDGLGQVTVSPGPPGCVVDAPARSVTCQLGDRARGEPVTVIVRGVVQQPGVYTNTANVTADNAAGVVEAEATFEVGAGPPTAPTQLGITKDATPGTLQPGEEVTFVVAVEVGPEGAAHLVLEDTLPAALEAVTVVPGEPTCALDELAGVVRCELGDRGPGTTPVVVRGRISEPGDHVNVATASADNAAASAQAEATVRVPGEPGIEIRLELPDEWPLGPPYLVSATLENVGDVELSNVRLHEILLAKAGVEIVDVDFNPGDSQGPGTCTIAATRASLDCGFTGQRHGHEAYVVATVQPSWPGTVSLRARAWADQIPEPEAAAAGAQTRVYAVGDILLSHTPVEEVGPTTNFAFDVAKVPDGYAPVPAVQLRADLELSSEALAGGFPDALFENSQHWARVLDDQGVCWFEATPAPSTWSGVLTVRCSVTDIGQARVQVRIPPDVRLDAIRAIVGGDYRDPGPQSNNELVWVR